jgi:hypothetical protein
MGTRSAHGDIAYDDRHELVADALAEGLTIAEAAARFAMTHAQVRAIFAEDAPLL